MNQAACALSEISQALNFNKGLLPLEPYEGLDTPPQLDYKDQFSWIAVRIQSSIYSHTRTILSRQSQNPFPPSY